MSLFFVVSFSNLTGTHLRTRWPWEPTIGMMTRGWLVMMELDDDDIVANVDNATIVTMTCGWLSWMKTARRWILQQKKKKAVKTAHIHLQSCKIAHISPLPFSSLLSPSLLFSPILFSFLYFPSHFIIRFSLFSSLLFSSLLVSSLLFSFLLLSSLLFSSLHFSSQFIIRSLPSCSLLSSSLRSM